MPTKTRSNIKVKPGLQFRYHHADSNPLWEVTGKSGRDVWECVIVDEPVEINGKIYPSDYSGTVKAFFTKEIQGSIGMSQLFEKLADNTNNFYASLKPGQIVHYHNSFNQYVRCAVVVENGENKLKPIALVGEWRDYDLPDRYPDGSIYFPYHVKQVLNGETFTPNDSCIFEAPGFHRDSKLDPRKLEPISLEVPPMTEKEEELAKLWLKIGEIQEISKQNDSASSLATDKHPQIILDEIKRILDAKTSPVKTAKVEA